MRMFWGEIRVARLLAASRGAAVRTRDVGVWVAETRTFWALVGAVAGMLSVVIGMEAVIYFVFG